MEKKIGGSPYVIDSSKIRVPEPPKTWVKGPSLGEVDSFVPEKPQSDLLESLGHSSDSDSENR